MKKVFFYFLTSAAASLSLIGSGEAVEWNTNYDQAVKEAQAKSKPIVLFFTGSDWCSWCNKLESEALDTKDFDELAGDKFIFVKLDFPMQNSLDQSTTEQNKSIQTKFDVRSFPTIIILDPNQKQIGITGYRPGGGKQYANHLLKIAQDFSAYQDRVNALKQN